MVKTSIYVKENTKCWWQVTIKNIMEYAVRGLSHPGPRPRTTTLDPKVQFVN